MASYGLDTRFKDPRHCFRLNDPSAYNHSRDRPIKPNKYGFSSSAPRVTKCWQKPYNEKIYDARIEHSIPNATSLKSKTPRFNFKPFTEEELDEILCRCDKEDPCVCPTREVVCEAYVHKRIFKGHPPGSVRNEGISIPTKRDRGFEILKDGTARRLLDVVVEESPPFYDARVFHFPEFYRGWKWSQWRAPRTTKSIEIKPGPADYNLEREKTQDELCLEKIRADKRKNSKQLRYIELVQERNIRENRVGPADYSPQYPKGTDLNFLGPKECRFPVHKLEKRPSPATYFVKRDFDKSQPPKKPFDKLPQPACFGVSAERFKHRIQQSPSPADYDANVNICKRPHCSKVPFGCSAKRFENDKIEYNYDESDKDEECEHEDEDEENTKCDALTWQFRSRTKRFRRIKTEFDPIIPYIRRTLIKKPVHLQALAPFNNSQGRFQPWFDWLPLHAGVGTPAPGYYNAMKATCLPAVNAGPLYRAQRFRTNMFITPAPNEYNIEGGVEDVLKTCNKRLKANVENFSKRFEWIPPPEPRYYSYEERELSIINKAIRDLDVEEPEPLVKLEEEESKHLGVQLEDKRASTGESERQVSTEEEELAGIERKRQTSSEGEKRASIEEEKRPSAEVEKRASTEGEKRPSAEGEKRASTEGEKRASTEGEKRASTEGEKRASTEGEKRSSTEGEKRTSTEGEKRASTEGEKRASIEGEKRASTEGEKRASTEGEKRASTEVEKRASIEGEKRASIEGEKRASTEGEKRASIEGEKRASTEGEKRASIEGEKRASIEGEKRASTEGEKRASTEGEKRASTEGDKEVHIEGEKRVSADKGEKQASSDDKEKSTGGLKGEKRASVEEPTSDDKTPKKLLRTFLHKHPQPMYF